MPIAKRKTKMKKLMIAVAALALAASTQAASYTWKWTSTLNNPNATAYSGDVYLFNAGDVSQQTMLTAFLADTGSFASTYVGQAIDSYGTSNGKGPSAPRSIAEADIGTLRESGSDHYVDYFYAAMFTSGDDKYLFLSDTYNVAVQASQETALSKSLSGASKAAEGTTTVQAGKNWYLASVPEPTSGLMLLLGFAGLALRRKRA